MANKEHLIKKFKEIYGKRPTLIVRAPGRINLIGEHTDYNEGFVLPIAINRYTVMLVSRRKDKKVRLYDLKYGERVEFELDSIEHSKDCKWSNYQRGVARVLLDEGYNIGGIDALIYSEIPERVGLSSSASVEIATLLSFKGLYELTIKPIEMVKLARRAENEFVGVECGIMDQFASVLSKEGYALFIDCRSLEYHYVRALISGFIFLVCNSMVERELASSAYNARRMECREALEILQDYIPDIQALRDVEIENLARYASHLSPTLRKRVEHVVYENERVGRAVEELEKGSPKGFGQLMSESHKSLKELYEVSSPELDLLIDTGLKTEGVLGARLTGAGFGGCVLYLVDEGSIDLVKEKIMGVYRQNRSDTPVLRRNPFLRRLFQPSLKTIIYKRTKG